MCVCVKYIVPCTLLNWTTHIQKILPSPKADTFSKTPSPPTFHLPRNASMMAAEVILFCSARVSLLIEAMARRKRGRKIATAAAVPPPLQTVWDGTFVMRKMHQNTGEMEGFINNQPIWCTDAGTNWWLIMLIGILGIRTALSSSPYLPCSNHQVVMTVSLPP